MAKRSIAQKLNHASYDHRNVGRKLDKLVSSYKDIETFVEKLSSEQKKRTKGKSKK